MAIPKIISNISDKTQSQFVDTWQQRRNGLNKGLLSTSFKPETTVQSWLNLALVAGMNYADIKGAFKEKTSGVKLLEGAGKKFAEAQALDLASFATTQTLRTLSKEADKSNLNFRDSSNTMNNLFKVVISPAVNLVSKDLNPQTYYKDVQEKAWEQYDENRLSLFKTLFYTLGKPLDLKNVEFMYGETKTEKSDTADVVFVAFKVAHLAILVVGELQKFQKLTQSTFKDKMLIYVVTTAYDLGEEYLAGEAMRLIAKQVFQRVIADKKLQEYDIRAFDSTIVGIGLHSAILACSYQVKNPLFEYVNKLPHSMEGA